MHNNLWLCVPLTFSLYSKLIYIQFSQLRKKKSINKLNKMHRSASWNRFSDDYFKHATTSSPSSGHRSSYSMFDGNNLPTYDPIAELAKRERARVKFAENAVHVIPLVLIICAIILWLFSNPGEWYRITCIKVRTNLFLETYIWVSKVGSSWLIWLHFW